MSLSLPLVLARLLRRGRPLVALLGAAAAIGLAPGAAQAQTARVIVKLRADSPLLTGRASAMAVVPSTGLPARMRALGERAGVLLQDGRHVSDRMQVALAQGITSEALARRLAAQSDVEWAVPDRRVRAAATVPPSDPLYASSGGSNGQWYLRAPTSGFAAAVNTQGAWLLTRGASNVVVAVVDTGVRFDHPDLQYKLLPGYDVISDALVANDSTGRDSDATDVGDRLTQADIDAHPTVFSGCSVDSTNSWHGTKVAGIIGAQTDNAIGTAGLGWNVRILPVRALGRCGGYESDIAAGIRWAAGLPVPGLPTNIDHPARVINLSLGSESPGACGSVYQSAINDVQSAGAVVVVSAGNNNGAVYAPGNCSNVITVGGLRHDGTKNGFSAFGSEVTLSAPGGNCGNQLGCLYTIVTTTNAGLTAPIAYSASYTDSANPAVGTSFSAPLVSGTVALMLSVNPQLSLAEIRSKLTQTARSFPSPLPSNYTCPTTDGNGSCNCTTSTCGAGMLDTQAAVAAAQAIVFTGAADPGQPAVGEVLNFSLAPSALASGEVATGPYAWSITENASLLNNAACSGSTAANCTVSALANGRFTVRLAVTTSLGVTRVFTRSVDVGPAPNLTPQPVTAERATSSSADTAGGGGGGGGALEAGWLLALTGAWVLAQRSRSRHERTPAR